MTRRNFQARCRNIAAASRRVWQPSTEKIRSMWDRTVCHDIPRAVAISASVRRSARSSATSASRGVNPNLSRRSTPLGNAERDHIVRTPMGFAAPAEGRGAAAIARPFRLNCCRSPAPRTATHVVSSALASSARSATSDRSAVAVAFWCSTRPSSSNRITPSRDSSASALTIAS